MQRTLATTLAAIETALERRCAAIAHSLLEAEARLREDHEKEKDKEKGKEKEKENAATAAVGVLVSTHHPQESRVSPHQGGKKVSLNRA